MLTLHILEEDIGFRKEYSETFNTTEELVKHMDSKHGHDAFEFELNVPQRLQYDETYYVTFTVV